MFSEAYSVGRFEVYLGVDGWPPIVVELEGAETDECIVQAAAVRLAGADRKRFERLMGIAAENIRQIRALVGIASGMLGEGGEDP